MWKIYTNYMLTRKRLITRLNRVGYFQYRITEIMKLLSHKVAAAESVAVARGPAPDPDSADDRPYAAAVLVVSSESRS